MRALKERKASTEERRTTARRGDEGFTLVETSIALMILLIVSLSVAGLFVYAVKNNTGGENRVLAAAVAQQHLERLRDVPFDNLAAAVTATGGSPKTVSTGSRNFTVVTTITNGPNVSGVPRIKTITVSVTPVAAGSAWNGGTFTLTTQRSSLANGPYD